MIYKLLLMNFNNYTISDNTHIVKNDLKRLTINELDDKINKYYQENNINQLEFDKLKNIKNINYNTNEVKEVFIELNKYMIDQIVNIILLYYNTSEQIKCNKCNSSQTYVSENSFIFCINCKHHERESISVNNNYNNVIIPTVQQFNADMNTYSLI